MKTLYSALLLLCVVLLCPITARADVDGSFFRFATLYTEYDFIVSGQVFDTRRTEDRFLYRFAVDEHIGGIAPGDTLEFSFNPSYCDYCFTFYVGFECVLFMTARDDSVYITYHGSGAFRYESKSDIKLLTEAYTTHDNLFSKEYADVLKEMYNSFTEYDSRRRLLYDFEKENILGDDDVPFIQSLLDSGDRFTQRQILIICGYSGIMSMRDEIEVLYRTSPDSGIRLHCLAALRELGHPDSYPLLLEALNDPDLSCRKNAIHAIGVYALNGRTGIIPPLMDIYADEEDFSTRSTIVTAISRARETSEAIQALQELLEIETDSIVISNIEYELEKLMQTGVAETLSAIELRVNPNPANPVAVLSFTIPQASPVRLAVYSVTGQHVATLLDGHTAAGSHTVMFDGSSRASGLYFYRFDTGDVRKTGKFTIIR